MALDPNKEVFIFVVEFESEETIIDDGDDDESESQESDDSEDDE